LPQTPAQVGQTPQSAGQLSQFSSESSAGSFSQIPFPQTPRVQLTAQGTSGGGLALMSLDPTQSAFVRAIKEKANNKKAKKMVFIVVC